MVMGLQSRVSALISTWRMQDEEYTAFKDRSPAAVHHVLLVPKTHIGECPLLVAHIPTELSVLDSVARQYQVVTSRGCDKRYYFHYPVNLTHTDGRTVERMSEIGHLVLDKLEVDMDKRRYGSCNLLYPATPKAVVSIQDGVRDPSLQHRIPHPPPLVRPPVRLESEVLDVSDCTWDRSRR